MRNRELSARESAGRPLVADRARQSASQRDRDAASPEQAAKRAARSRRSGRPAANRRALARVADRAQGSRRKRRASAPRSARRIYRDFVPDEDALIVERLRGGRERSRSARPTRPSSAQARRPSTSLRRDAEPVRLDEDLRRQQRRGGGRAGLRDAAHRRRQRYGRIACGIRRISATSSGFGPRRDAFRVGRPKRLVSDFRRRTDGPHRRGRRVRCSPRSPVPIRVRRSRFREPGRGVRPAVGPGFPGHADCLEPRLRRASVDPAVDGGD